MKGKKTLIIHEEPSTMFSLIEALESFGFEENFSVNSLSEAAFLLSNEKLDYVFIDSSFHNLAENRNFVSEVHSIYQVKLFLLIKDDDSFDPEKYSNEFVSGFIFSPYSSKSIKRDLQSEAFYTNKKNVNENKSVSVNNNDTQISSFLQEIKIFSGRERYLKSYYMLSREASDAILFIDYPSGLIIDANETAIKMYGYGRKELIGKNIGDLRSTTNRTQVQTDLRNAFKEGVLFETIHLKKNGMEFPVEVSSRGYEMNTERGILSIVRDISQRKKSENELELSKKRLESIVEINQYDSSSREELLRFALSKAVALSDSWYGYLFTYNEETQIFDIAAWSAAVMSECRVEYARKTFNLDKSGIWGDVVRFKKPLLINNFLENNERKHGFPQGHIIFKRFLSIPVIVDDSIVAVIGVADKKTDYTDIDVLELTLLMDTMWSIIRQKESEAALKASLNEKEILLKEVNHRVKNNLQIITSLLRMQTAGIKDPIYKAEFLQAESRVRTMSYIHELLYESKDFSAISFRRFLEILSSSTASTYHPSRNIAVQIESDNIVFKLDIAVPLGLILNELVCNAFQYGCDPNGQGKLVLSLKKNDKNYVLGVKDSGPGLPHEVELANQETLGLSLVRVLASQIDAEIEYRYIDGASFTLFFSEPK